jgi:hypothetical protein
MKTSALWLLEGFTVGFAKKGYGSNFNSYVVVSTKRVSKTVQLEVSSKKPPFAHRTRTMVKSPIKKINDSPHSANHYRFISWKPMTFQCTIDSRSPVRWIRHLGVVGFHHAATVATGKYRHGVLTMRRLANHVSNVRQCQNQPKSNHCATSYLHQYLLYGDVWNTHPVRMHRRKTHAPYLLVFQDLGVGGTRWSSGCHGWFDFLGCDILQLYLVHSMYEGFLCTRAMMSLFWLKLTVHFSLFCGPST